MCCRVKYIYRYRGHSSIVAEFSEMMPSPFLLVRKRTLSRSPVGSSIACNMHALQTELIQQLERGLEQLSLEIDN